MPMDLRIRRIRENITKLAKLFSEGINDYTVNEYQKLTELLNHDRREIGDEIFNRIAKTKLEMLNIQVSF